MGQPCAADRTQRVSATDGLGEFPSFVSHMSPPGRPPSSLSDWSLANRRTERRFCVAPAGGGGSVRVGGRWRRYLRACNTLRLIQGEGTSPYRALRANIRFTFQAMVTRLHSPRTLSSPRSRNCRKPRTDLMMPNTGSAMIASAADAAMILLFLWIELVFGGAAVLSRATAIRWGALMLYGNGKSVSFRTVYSASVQKVTVSPEPPCHHGRWKLGLPAWRLRVHRWSASGGSGSRSSSS